MAVVWQSDCEVFVELAQNLDRQNFKNDNEVDMIVTT